MSKRTQKAVDELMAAQAPIINSEDIPPGVDMFPTMEAAWLDFAVKMRRDLSRRQLQDAKFIFFTGVQAAANLMIYGAGQSQFETAANQVIADCIAYEKEAEAVVRERRLDDPPSEERTH
jgi:hypothetical protein